jgi:hypothetical protein
METLRRRHGKIKKWRLIDIETWRHGHEILTFYKKNLVENENPVYFP